MPAISYGGPEVPPDQPSPESQKLAESGVLIQFLADLDERLLPKDPVTRAKARFFIETVTPLISNTFYGSLSRGEDPEAVLKAFESIQKLLPEEGYAVGEWSIADAAVTPFFARAELAFTNDYGKYEEGKGKAVWEKLQTDEKYARFCKYYEDLKSRPSFNATFYPVCRFAYLDSCVQVGTPSDILLVFRMWSAK